MIAARLLARNPAVFGKTFELARRWMPEHVLVTAYAKAPGLSPSRWRRAVIGAGSSASPDRFTTSAVGSDYFMSEGHYLFLARRIVAALRADGNVVLVIGDPPAGSRLLCRTLRKTTASRCPVIGIACGPKLTAGELSHAGSATVGPPARGGGAAPLFVFDDVDQLSEQQIKEIYAVIQHGARKSAGVLLARPGFVARLQEPSLQFLKEALAGQFRFQYVDEEESIEFLRHQFVTGHRPDKARGVLLAAFRALVALAVMSMLGIGAFFGLPYMAGEPGARTTADTLSLPPASLPNALDAKTTPAVDPAEAVSSTLQPPAALLPAQESATPDASSLAAEPVPAQAAQESATPDASSLAAEPVPAQAAQESATPDASSLAAEPAPEQAARAPDPTLHTTSPLSTQLPVGQQLLAAEIAELVSRGDAFLRARDVASARLFYERAADAGDATAALRLSATFDPDFLGRAGIRGALADPIEAGSWYRRARQLEEAAAERQKTINQ
jgi:hypothetical protein